MGLQLQGIALLALLTCLDVANAAQAVESNPPKQDNNKVKIGVYIESLCPDSRRFFTRQLEPVYHMIGSIMEPTIVPFGHARTLGNDKMVCQHGLRECEGNRQMACIISRAKNLTESIDTISCIFERAETPRDCIAKYMSNADFNDIEKCKSSNESYKMMEIAEKETGRVSYIPHLTFNNKHSEDIQNGMESDLKDFVCKNYNGTKPEACNDHRPHNMSPNDDFSN